MKVLNCASLFSLFSIVWIQIHNQCCGAGPFLTGSGYFFHRLRLQLILEVGLDLVKKNFLRHTGTYFLTSY